MMNVMQCLDNDNRSFPMQPSDRGAAMERQNVRTDAEIIAGILAGDRDLFAILMNRYERLVYSITLRSMRERAQAEDAAQETFVKAYLHLDAYNPEYRFSTWISRIAQNTCTDLHRRQRETTGIEEAEWMPDPGLTPEESFLRRECAETLAGHVASLDEMYREPLMMYHAKGLKYDEIANALDIPMSMVKNRIFRARRMLRSKLAGIAV